MAFTIASELSKKTSPLFFDPKFRATVEDHLHILKTVGITVTPIELQVYWKYEGNFYGFLTHHAVKPNLQWIYLRVNGFHHPHEFASTFRDPLNRTVDPYLIEPNEQLIDNLIKFHSSRKD